MCKKIWSRIPNDEKTVECENPDCGRKDRPLYVWHGEDGKCSLLLCDLCTVESMSMNDEVWPGKSSHQEM